MKVTIEFGPSFTKEDLKELLRDVKEAHPPVTGVMLGVMLEDRGTDYEEWQKLLEDVFPEWVRHKVALAKPCDEDRLPRRTWLNKLRRLR